MRFLVVSHGYPPTISGVTVFAQKLARAMVRKGHAVTVVTASDRGQPYEDEDQGVRLIRVRSLSNPFWKEGPVPHIAFRELEAIVHDFQPDLLHTHESAGLALHLLRLGRTAGLPVIATCHYVPRFVTHYLGGAMPALVESLVWAYSIWLFNQFDRVVFDSLAHRSLFVQRGLEVPTAIISCGLDTERYHPPDGTIEAVEQRYRLPPRPRLLFASRLARDKEIDVLIRAMAVICAEREAHLLLVGRGDDRPRLEALAASLGLTRWVHFLGFVPEEDMPAIYRAADLFAIASTCEVLSIPTLQALATGLPVVAVDALALPELVYDGVNGFLVPPGNPEALAQAVLRILNDPDLAARMGRASLSIAEPHAEKHTFELYEELYHRTVVDWQAGLLPVRPLVPALQAFQPFGRLAPSPYPPTLRPAMLDPWPRVAELLGPPLRDGPANLLAFIPPSHLSTR
jgi:glycosyltransferase involved in cell wall biosynthesis